jgi:signal transduction histidine kinase
VEPQLSSAASSRLESLILRLFALTLLLSSIESVANGLEQLHLLNLFGQLMIVVLVVLVVMIQLSVWLSWQPKTWIIAFTTFALFSMLAWPFSVSQPEVLPAEFQPWVWWVIGMAVVAMGVVAKPPLALSYMFLTVVIWFFIDTSFWGGTSDPIVSLEDSTYVTLLGGTVLGLFILVRDAVSKVDAANTTAINSAILQASVDAAERERQRIDALVHDHVLNTLLLAAKAQGGDAQKSAAKSAREAIASLHAAAEEPTGGQVTTLGLFRALRKAAIQIIPKIEVRVLSGGTESIPEEVAKALAEAIIQAMDNVARHAKTSRASLTLSALEPGGVFIELRDFGIGFRLDRIPRDRIGVRTSIFARLEAVKGKATIDTQPGLGTKVILEWRP